MEKKPSLKLAAVLLLLATMTCMELWRMPVAEARGAFECRRMQDCRKVCAGSPSWKCVDGKCICSATPSPMVSQGMALWRIPVAEARGELRCPRMIDCSKVCQGYPWRCVDGKCICGESPPKSKDGGSYGPSYVELH